MPFTHRQWSKHMPAFGLWALISILCTLSGPFGTIEGLPPLARLIYWSAVVGICVLGSVWITALDLKSGWHSAIAWTLYALVISASVYLFNIAYFGGTARAGSFIYLTAIVGAIVVVVHGLLWLAFRSLPDRQAEPPESVDVSVQFQRRLPLAARGSLVRIEAQDHYLNVVTTNGETLILMRLSEAVEALDGVAGLQVHRSHWVAFDAVRSHHREGSRDWLKMSDGILVPVARNRRAKAKEAGLL